jgi:hypothetical protein
MTKKFVEKMLFLKWTLMVRIRTCVSVPDPHSKVACIRIRIRNAYPDPVGVQKAIKKEKISQKTDNVDV